MSSTIGGRRSTKTSRSRWQRSFSCCERKGQHSLFHTHRMSEGVVMGACANFEFSTPVNRTACCMPSIRAGSPILLLGGAKAADDRWYEKYIPEADALYNSHLDELKSEGEIE